jgi:hypothetical protein
LIRWTDEELHRLSDLLASGVDWHEAAAHYKTSVRALKKALQRYEQGLSRRRACLTGDKEIQRIKKLLLQGASINEVAAEYKVHYGSAYRAVRRVADRFGLKMVRQKVKDAGSSSAKAVEKPKFDAEAHYASRHYRGNFDD